MPKQFDNNSFEQWAAEGSLDCTDRALRTAKQMLRDYEKPALDPAINEALLDYIARRERDIPAMDALNQVH